MKSEADGYEERIMDLFHEDAEHRFVRPLGELTLVELHEISPGEMMVSIEFIDELLTIAEDALLA